MSTRHTDRTLRIGGTAIEMPWPILDVLERDGIVLVLLDPDSYLADASYKLARDQGAPAMRNLIAFNSCGDRLWDAELPESSDYYYKVRSESPLAAYSFSSFLCELDLSNGRIARKTFLK